MDMFETSSWAVAISLLLVTASAMPLIYQAKHFRKLWLDVRICFGGAGQDKLWETEASLESKESEPWPTGWLTDETHFGLEQNVILRKKCLFVAHTSEFLKPGDYQTFNIASFPILVILGKDKKLRAFHNVCRHRAYVVTKKESGSSTVLGCRYHGWSYDTKGQLIKAPEFDHVPGFDKSINGLFEVGILVKEECVFINIDKDWKEAMVDEVKVKSLEKWGLGKMSCVARWKSEREEGSDFNWKLLGETRMDIPYFWIPTKFPKRYQSWNQKSAPSVFLSPSTCLWRIEKGAVLILTAYPKTATKTALGCIILSQSRQSAAKVHFWRGIVEQHVEKLVQKQESITNYEARRNAQQFENQQQQNIRQDVIQLLKPYTEGNTKPRVEFQPRSGMDRCFSKEGRDDDDFCRKLDLRDGGDSICRKSAAGFLDW